MRLKNQAVLVTGSASGIGKAIALKCAREGASVGEGSRQIRGVRQVFSVKMIRNLQSDKKW